MKSIWDYPSRAAAVLDLGVEGFVAALVRAARGAASPSASALRGEHGLRASGFPHERRAVRCERHRSRRRLQASGA